MKRIVFYTTESGKCPVQEHLNRLPDKTVQKIAWTLRVVRDLERVPANHLKKLVNTEGIWEVRADFGGNAFRLLGFFDGAELIVLTNSFQKKSQQTSRQEVRLAEQRRSDYLKRRRDHG